MNQIKAGISLSYILILINNVVKLAYTPFLIRTLGQSEFGLYSLASATVGYLAIMDLGFGNAIIRFTSKYTALGDEDKVNGLHGMFLLIYGIIGCIVAVLGYQIYLNTAYFFGNSMSFEELARVRKLILLLTLNLAITFPFSIFGSIIIANEKFIFSKTLSIVIVLLNPLIMIPVLVLGYKSIALVLVITILNFLMLLSNLFYCYKVLKIRPKYFYFDKKLFSEVFGYSFFVFLNAIIDQVYWNTGQFILGSVSGTVSVAIYSVALTIKGLYFALSTSFVNVLLPKVTNMVTNKVTNMQLTDLFVKVGRIQYLILSFILSLFILFGKKFVKLWAGDSYSDAYLIALCILVPLTIPLMQNLGITILQAKNKQRFRSITYFIVAMVSVLISIPLAKQMGGLGCALAIGSCLLIGNGLVMNIYYHKVTGLDIIFFWKEILSISIPVVSVTLVFYQINSFFNNNLLIYFMKIILFSSFFYFSLWFFGMNNYEKGLIKSIISKIKK